MLLLWDYALTPGRESERLSQWPADSNLVLGKDRPTLLVFVHPRCPCSRATIQELAVALAAGQRPLNIQVVVYKPGDAQAGWEQTDLWHAAQGIPRVALYVDYGGVEAKRFSVTTSGHALLFAADGTCIFSGGITAARGHQGASAGQDALVALLTGGQRQVSSTPVYGCPF